MRKLSHEEIVKRQKLEQAKERLPVVVVLNNIRSLYNVGSIFRSADGAGIKKIYICGITGYPPNNQISKTALGAEESVPFEYHREAFEVVKQLKSEGYSIVMLEQMESSISYDEYVPTSPVCIVIGNEIEGVSSNLIEQCDQSVEIEMAGIKNSLNVSVAFGIIAYQMKSAFKKNKLNN